LSRNNDGNFGKYLQVAVAFGITTALRIYILGVLVGGWLDRKFAAGPWFTLSGVLIAVFLSFKFLLDQFSDTAGRTKKGEKR